MAPFCFCRSGGTRATTSTTSATAGNRREDRAQVAPKRLRIADIAPIAPIPWYPIKCPIKYPFPTHRLPEKEDPKRFALRHGNRKAYGQQELEKKT